MGEVVSIVSGKGGTGKTTLCAGIASSLAADGQSVLCIDADIGLRNLDIALGMAELPAIAFTDVLDGRCSLKEATPHPSFPSLFLLTSPLRTNGSMVDSTAFAQLVQQARAEFDWCLIDAPAGIGSGFQLATQNADRCLVVSTPDRACMRDAARTTELLLLNGVDELYLVVNRILPRLFSRMALTVDDIMDETGLPLLGLVPEDPKVVLAAAKNKPLVRFTRGGAAEACQRITYRLRGKQLPLMRLK